MRSMKKAILRHLITKITQSSDKQKIFKAEIIEYLHKNNNNVMCICNISNNKMYKIAQNSTKAKRGEIKTYYCKFLVLHVKWYNIT